MAGSFALSPKNLIGAEKVNGQLRPGTGGEDFAARFRLHRCQGALPPPPDGGSPGIFERRRMALTPAGGCGDAGALARPGPLP